MKRKLLSAVLALTLLMSMGSAFAAGYTDVTSGSKVSESVELLSALNILTGYTDGTFRPDATITRAEFAAVTVRSLGLESAASGMAGVTPFSDVPANHWAAGYINLAYNNNIINGHGDGTFAPEDPVLYEEAIKMIVATLGYKPEADTLGTYPGNYLTIAAREGILSNVSGGSLGAEAPRGMVSLMLYNALEVPMMAQFGFGTNSSFEKSSTILLDRLDIDKVEGKVTKVPGSSSSNSLSAHQVEYTILKTYETINGRRTTVNQSNYVLSRLDAGDTDAKDYLERYTYAYIIGLDSDEPKIAAIIGRSGKNSTFYIDAGDICDDKLSSLSSGRLYYYTDDDQSRTDYVTIDTADFVYYYNGKKVSGASIDDLYDAIIGETTFNDYGINGYIELLDNTNNDEYNVIYVTDYLDLVVDSTSQSRYAVYSNGSHGTVYLDEEDDNYTFEIIKDGRTVSFEDIQKDDVLSIYGNIEDRYLTNGTVKILNNSTIEGKITGISGTTNIVYIDGERYWYDYDVEDSMKIGYEYVFYINQVKKVIAVDRTNITLNQKFGFVTELGKSSGIGSNVEFRVLRSDGVWTNLELNDKVFVNGSSSTVSSSDIISSWNNYKPTEWASGNINGNVISVYSMISYTLNSSGKISRINFQLDNPNVREDEFTYKSFSGTYYESTESIGGIGLTGNTVIFSISVSPDNLYNADESDITVSSKDALADYDNYSGKAFILDDSGDAVAMVGYDIVGRVQYTSPIMIVSGVSYTYKDNDTYTSLEGYSSSEKVTVDYLPEETTIVDRTGLGIQAKPKVGDVIAYSGDKNTSKLEIMFRPGEMISNGTVINKNSAVKYFSSADITSNTNNKVEYYYGLARSRSGKTLKIVLDDTIDLNSSTETLLFSGNTNGAQVYSYDSLNYANPKVKLMSVGDIEIDKNADNSPYSDMGDFVMLRVENGTRIKDIVIVRREDRFVDDNAAPTVKPTDTASPGPSAPATPSASPGSSDSAASSTSPAPSDSAASLTSPAPSDSAASSTSPAPSASATPSTSPAPSASAASSTSPAPSDSAASLTSPAPSDSAASSTSPVPSASAASSDSAIPTAGTGTQPESSPTPGGDAEDASVSPIPTVTPSAPQIETVTGTSTVIAMKSLKNISKGSAVVINNKSYTVGVNAFDSISAAVNAVSGGGEVLVCGDTYNEDIRISKPITVTGDSKVFVNGTFEIAVNNVTLKNMNIVYNRTSAGEPAVLMRDNVKNSTVSVKGCTFSNGKASPNGVDIKGGTDKVNMTVPAEQIKPTTVFVADFTGKNINEIKVAAFERQNIIYVDGEQAKGTIVKQIPASGQVDLSKEKVITFYVSNGSKAKLEEPAKDENISKIMPVTPASAEI